jgi:hypothetical protein
MLPRCQKPGCKREAVAHGEFIYPYHWEASESYGLCAEHANEAREFDEMDEARIRSWLSEP